MTLTQRDRDDLGYTGEIIDALASKFLNVTITKGAFMNDNTQTNLVLYSSIDDYKAVTGRRFRMTKEQKTRSLTREQAFAEFCNSIKMEAVVPNTQN